MKAVNLLMESELPESMRQYDRVYDAKALNGILADVGRNYPEHYSNLIAKMAKHGREASWNNGETLTLKDLEPVIDRDGMLAKMDMEIASMKDSAPNAEEFKNRRETIWNKYSDLMDKESMKAGLEQGNNIAYSIGSGARGKTPQMKSMVTTPGIYADGNGKLIPMFVRNSHADGLRPVEFLASTFGARASVVSVKAGTAKGGDLGKQLSQISSSLVVNKLKAGHDNGIDLDIEDSSLKYRVLARPAGGYAAGTLISRSVMADLKRKKVLSVIVHSPLTDNNADGISAESTGGRDGRMPGIGDMVGITSGHAIGEPITQASLGAKHTAGMTGGKKTFSGFAVINQLVQSPESFPHRAAVSELDGKVENISEAPQGGTIIKIGGQEHYALPGFAMMVKPGDTVEAGDQLSDGIVDPRDIVRLRGLGEGRKYYANRLKQALDDTGIYTDLKHTEMIARAAINHVRVEDPDGVGDYLPDDVVSYNKLASTYVPPTDARFIKPADAVGTYLHAPALHYTIGTKLTPRMTKHLSDTNFGNVTVSGTAPGFVPEMNRLRTASHSSDDWLQKLTSSYQSKNLIDSATRGEDTNVESNVNWAPRLAVGVGFGKDVKQTGLF